MKKVFSERFGLVMIITTLFVIILIATQLLIHNKAIRNQAIKIEGRNIIGLLSTLSVEQLIPDQGRNTILDLLNSSQNHSSFAYAAIVNQQNQPLAVTGTGKIAIPEVPLEDSKTLWATEHELEKDQNHLIEFRAPILSKGELAGYIRVGYFQPDIEFELQELPFLAQLALPIFLLVPFTYMLIRRELSPLRQASEDISKALKKQNMTTAMNSADDFQGFMQNFKLFMTMIDQRFEHLGSQNVKAQASTLAISYQRHRIESVLQSMPDGILVMDETGAATFANSKLVSLLAGSMDLILGFKPQDWCENNHVIELLAKYHSNGNRWQRSDKVEFNPKNFPDKTISVSAFPLFAPKEIETVCGTLVIFHDKTQEVLASSARDEFISHVAHELKSPLNVIHMYAELLLDEPGVSDEQRISAVNTINDEVERLALLISNLLNISKIEAGSVAINSQRIKLAEFLEDTFNSVARSGNENNIKFDLQMPRALSTIQADKDLLRIAINNLLTNAVKYNSPGGSVSLQVEETDSSVFIRVSDTGIGISQHDLEHIFDKFYRSTNDNVLQKNGHGLGLSLVKEIIELHHGKISVESTPDKGSIFSIELKKTQTTI
jgi:signal transduction histidine kinase